MAPPRNLDNDHGIGRDQKTVKGSSNEPALPADFRTQNVAPNSDDHSTKKAKRQKTSPTTYSNPRQALSCPSRISLGRINGGVFVGALRRACRRASHACLQRACGSFLDTSDSLSNPWTRLLGRGATFLGALCRTCRHASNACFRRIWKSLPAISATLSFPSPRTLDLGKDFLGAGATTHAK